MLPPMPQNTTTMTSFPRLDELPEGIFSLLDTDLYKLTMQCAVLRYLPDIQVTYAFTNRTHDMRLNRGAYHWLEAQIEKLGNIALSTEELAYLKRSCPFFPDVYLRFLNTFRFQPSKEVKVTFAPVEDAGNQEDRGDIHLKIGGLWLHTILYEIPLLALTSEAYFRFCDKDWNHDMQEEKAYTKGIRLMSHDCVFSEFGTRRRRDYRTHDLVMQGLMRAAKEGENQTWNGKLSGTSNVHMAMKYGLPPVGTVAHEWFMGIASVTNDYEHANETALRYWVGTYGEGVLGIALTDTFGTPVFLKAFRKALPTKEEAELATDNTQLPGEPRPAITAEKDVIDVHSVSNQELVNGATNGSKPRSYAETFTGVRQDSGDPLEFVKTMRDFYDREGIKAKKTIVFSDSLNVDLCIQYREAAEAQGFLATFGVGTYLTNDFTHVSTGKKSVPLNIVIKISSASGRPAIKISDNMGKNTGDADTVHKVKETLGYVEKQWAAADEKARWGTEDDNSTAFVRV